MRVRTLAVAVTVALGVGLIAAIPATAAKAPSTIKVTDIKEIGPGPAIQAKYTGKVDSPRNKCKKRRKVTLIHLSKPPFKIGTTHTDANGDWSIIGDYPLDEKDDKI